MALLEKLAEIQKKKVMVIGDAMLDHNVLGDCTRLSPEGPYKVLSVKNHTYILGGAANVANNARTLGCKTTLCCLSGPDEAGKRLAEIAKKNGLVIYSVEENGRKTTEKIRFFAEGIRLDPRVDEETPTPATIESKKKIITIVQQQEENNDVFVLSDYDKGIFKGDLAQLLIQDIKKLKKKIIAAPKPNSMESIKKFNGADAMIMNQKEAGVITNIAYSEKEKLEEMGKKIHQNLDVGCIIITCGKDGMFAMEKNGRSHFVQTKARTVSDVTGAGDTSTIVLSLALGSECSIDEALTLANYAAGIVVEKPGTATVSFAELIERIKEDYK